MSIWIRQNLTLSVVITLIIGYGAGAAAAAVLYSDVQQLKEKIKTMPEELSAQGADITTIKKSLERIENKLMK